MAAWREAGFFGECPCHGPPLRPHGFDKVSAADLRKRLEPLVRKTQAFSKRIAHKGIWVEPKLLAEIEYRAKSAE
jgi:bifunctional non-homologous end joining protein LigD